MPSSGTWRSCPRTAAAGWRNWGWLALLTPQFIYFSAVLVLILLIGGGGIYWSLFHRVYGLDVYQTAMHDIQGDKGLRQQLGEPIQAVVGWRPPNARIEATEKDVLWDIAGPKGSAKAHVFARLMQGKWEVVQLEVVLANGKRMHIAGEGDAEAEAPPFMVPKAEPKKSEANAPAPEINLPIPPNDGPAKP